MKFKLTSEFIKKYPDAIEMIVIARGVHNEIASKWISDLTQKVSDEVRAEGAGILKEQRFAMWEQVFSDIAKEAEFKTGDFHSSHVALTKRVLNGKDIPNINPVVNFYNMYSLKYGVPFGGEDLSTVYGDMELTITKGGEPYHEIGSSKVSNLGPNEVAWIDDHSVTCRMWNWRQCDRTKVMKNTRDIYFIIDGFRGIKGLSYQDIAGDFTKDLEEKFGAKVDVYELNKENLECDVDYDTKEVGDLDVEADLLRSANQYEKKSTRERKGFMKRKVTSMGLEDDDNVVPRLNNFVKNSLGKKLPPKISDSLEVTVSQNPDFGDVSSPVALRLAKDLKQAPKEIAGDIVGELNSDPEVQKVFQDISVAPNGFINFKLSEFFLLSELSKALKQADSYGSSDIGKGRVILVEGPSINPNAAAHAGHLMNIFICRTLVRLFKKGGFQPEIDNLINDKGIKICMAMWGIKNLAEKKTPEEAKMKSDQFVGKYYVLAKKAYKEDPEAKAEIQQLLRDWETGKPDVLELWRKVIDWAFAGHRKTLERLGEKVGHLWLESEVYKSGKEIIQKFLGRSIIEKLSDGAVVGRLEKKYGLPDVVLLRSDGTGLYHTQDIALTLKKIEKFNPWRAIWVVGNEQILHFQQLFALLDELGLLPLDRVYHYAYGLVVDKNGEKIGKDANDATADTLLDIMHKEALKVIDERKIKVDLEDKDAVAEAVGIGALRYGFLSTDPYKPITFDPDEALSFTGKSGPYIMYAYSRGRNVLRNAIEGDVDNYKVSDKIKDKSHSTDMTEIDRDLIFSLLQYPEVIVSAINNYAPNVLAEYLYSVASKFSYFYEKETVSGADGPEKELRIAITFLTTRVIKDGLGLLGIKVLEKM
ncbi:arginine--tRNA ligase [Candidatus Dojkabacteria bacterium]|nr:arginine--tRNA ligase [Candidatus Dojkabacteria bacterium]